MNLRHGTVIRTVAAVGLALGLATAARGASPGPAAPPAVMPSGSINGLAVGPDGRLYGADCGGARVFRFDTDGPVVVAGIGSQSYSGDGGQATEAGLYCPFGPAFDERGMFILDHGNNRIRLVDPTGAISTFAGSGPAGIGRGALEGDGGPAADARFNEPIGIAIDADGAIFIGDRDNYVVRRIDPQGVVTTIAGTGVPGFSGDGGPAAAAQVSNPEAIAVDDAGNIYFDDTGNHRVRRIDPDGIITTVAGNGAAGSTGDGGPASAASLNRPQEGLVIDAAGALYVTEGQRIRRIDPDGTITTYAGTGEAGHSGDGGPATAAQLQDPAGLAMGRDGVLYVSSDGYSPSCVHSITPDGLIHELWCHP